MQIRARLTTQTRDVRILKCCVRISLQILTTDLHPHSPLPTQTPSRSRVSSPSELRKLGQWRRINGCSCGAWSRGDADRTRPSALYYSICSLCSAGQLAECQAWVNDPHQSASANFRERAVRDSQRISRILADACAVRTSLLQTAVAVRAATVARRHGGHLMPPPHLPPHTRNTRSQRPHKTRSQPPGRPVWHFKGHRERATDVTRNWSCRGRLFGVFQAANDRRWDNYRRTALFVQRRGPCWLLSVVCARL